MCLAKCVNYDNIFEAETETVLGTAVERLLSSASETRAYFCSFGRSKFELSSAHEKIGV